MGRVYPSTGGVKPHF